MSAAVSTARRPRKEDDREPANGGTMSFLEHLEDLRKRLIYSCIALATGMAIAFGFMDRLATFVFAPTMRALPAGAER